MSKIFVSYRRTDSSGHAGRLYDRLKKQFGDKETFLDVVNIEDGQDFPEIVRKTIGECKVLIAIIGKSWLSAVNEKDVRRLDEELDYVRLEIAAALKRDIRVIPVLVDEAAMPQTDDLPEPLKPLATRQARLISHQHFDRDVNQLIVNITKALGAPIGPDDPSEQAYCLGTECLTRNDCLGAARHFEFASDRGHIGALLKLGEMKARGIEIPRDVKEAYRLLTLAANNGERETQYEAGRILFAHSMNEQEFSQTGAALIELAAEHGHIPAQLSFGTILQQRADFKQAAFFYGRAADGGEPRGALELARLYKRGAGVPHSIREALKWYELAADATVTEARREFVELIMELDLPHGGMSWRDYFFRREELDLPQGGMSRRDYFYRREFGDEPPIVREEIARLYRRAAEYAGPWIQAAIGLRFLTGQHPIPKDEAEGMRLIRAAADAGGPSLKVHIAEQLLGGPHEPLALTYLQDAAKEGDAKLQMHIAERLLGGPHEPLALTCLQDAANEGGAELQMEIGLRFLDGWGRNYINEEQAIKWLTAATEAGDVGTRRKISERFLNITRKGTTTTVTAWWFQTAAAGGDAIIQLAVAKKHLRVKKGVPINRDEGLKWLHKAASNGSIEAQRIWFRLTDTDWSETSGEKQEPPIVTPARGELPGPSES